MSVYLKRRQRHPKTRAQTASASLWASLRAGIMAAPRGRTRTRRPRPSSRLHPSSSRHPFPARIRTVLSRPCRPPTNLQSPLLSGRLQPTLITPIRGHPSSRRSPRRFSTSGSCTRRSPFKPTSRAAPLPPRSRQSPTITVAAPLSGTDGRARRTLTSRMSTLQHPPPTGLPTAGPSAMSARCPPAVLFRAFYPSGQSCSSAYTEHTPSSR